jgi:prepilin peptidase CpaA
MRRSRNPRWAPMTTSAILSHTVLVITAAVLLYAAWIDMRHFKIRNELIIVLTGLFVLHAIISGRWVEIYWNLAVAFFVFLILLIFYVRKAVGGGDLKLLTIGYLWVGHTCMFPFTVLLLVFAIIHTILAKIGLVTTVGPDRRRVAFAPTVAAALIGTFMLGCLDQHFVSNSPARQEFQGFENGKGISLPLSK